MYSLYSPQLLYAICYNFDYTFMPYKIRLLCTICMSCKSCWQRLKCCFLCFVVTLHFSFMLFHYISTTFYVGIPFLLYTYIFIFYQTSFLLYFLCIHCYNSIFIYIYTNIYTPRDQGVGVSLRPPAAVQRRNRLLRLLSFISFIIHIYFTSL